MPRSVINVVSFISVIHVAVLVAACGSRQPFEETDGSINWCQRNTCPALPGDAGSTPSPAAPDDYDEDGRKDDLDNCPFVKNTSQADGDGDGVGDACDACPAVSDKDQLDADGDGIGDRCDPDIDNDGLANAKDNCPDVSNNFSSAQPDADKDGKGDACDTDDDNDGVLDADDNCPLVPNPLQENSDPNKYGEKCDKDADLDNIDDSKDNCPMVANADQKDSDGDKLGDACDADRDNDKVLNMNDNCPDLANPSQLDADRDGKGDACDSRFCFVVYGDEKNCLDPKSTFRVYSPELRCATGRPVLLRAFVNRAHVSVGLRWAVATAPAGGRALLYNPEGRCSVAGAAGVYCAPPAGKDPGVVVDRPGVYALKLSAELQGADPVNPAFPRSSSLVLTLHADGPDSCIPDRCFTN